VALRTYVAISRFARSRVTEATAVAPWEADATYEVRGNWDLRDPSIVAHSAVSGG
jgi:hypothetical protein